MKHINILHDKDMTTIKTIENDTVPIDLEYLCFYSKCLEAGIECDKIEMADGTQIVYDPSVNPDAVAKVSAMLSKVMPDLFGGAA